MTITEAITRANLLRPNAVPDSVKSEWLYSIDAQVAEQMGEDDHKKVWPEDDTELLIPFPHDEFYVWHVMAKIDLINEETSLYAADAAVANQMMSESCRWYQRNKKAEPYKPVKVM